MNRVLLFLLCLVGLAITGAIVFVIIVATWPDLEPEQELEEKIPKRSPGFRVRYGETNFGEDHFIALPQSVSEAMNQSWTEEQRPNQVLPSLKLYCHSSYIICVLYDDTEYVAGIQVAFPENEFDDAVFNWETQGYSKWTSNDGKSYWATQQYFVDELFLEISAEEREAMRDPNQLLQAGRSVWVSGIRGELVEIFNSGNETQENSGFNPQACIPMMGKHYWRLTNETECNDELFPWFALYDTDNEIVGSGLKAYGKFQMDEGDWFERPSKDVVQMIVPYGPDCLLDLAENPGLVTIHIYYIDTPWDIECEAAR